MADSLDTEKMAVFSQIPVSRETQEKLCAYVQLLFEWNSRFNLVADRSLPHVWTRHILDSAQLYNFIPSTARSLADLGSGAGFPGLVLAIMGAPHVHLVESIGKKALFLRHVVETLELDVRILHERIESIKGTHFDVVTARALKALPELIKLAKPLTYAGSVCLFLKGQTVDAELTEARKYWTFTCERKQSLSDPNGSLLTLTDLKALKPHGHVAPRRT